MSGDRIEMRRKVLKRDLYGYTTGKWDWGPWEALELNVRCPETRLEFWVDLNNYAVSQRGEDSRIDFRIFRQDTASSGE
jgi:hypothetical protein